MMNTHTASNIGSSQATVEKEVRRIQRISLPLPARIEVKIDPRISWTEMTRLSDVSAYGAGFHLKKPIKRGRMVLMTIPMPRQLRSFDFSEPQYRVWALVRRCISVGRSREEQAYSVGVAFTGKNPPPGYMDHPSMLYDIVSRPDHENGMWQLQPANLMADESHLPKEIRKQTRFGIPESLTLEIIDDAGNIVRSESTVSENISYGGAAVFTTMAIEAGSFVRVSCERLDVQILSVVRGCRRGPDGIARLHVEFVDRFFPLEGIA